MNLGIALYSVLARCVRSAFGGPDVAVWERNSFYFRNITPFVSDIDFSFRVSGRSDREVSELARRYARLRRICPIFGEANFYAPEKEPFLRENANPLELARDPVFLAVLGASRPTTPASKFVFLSRMLGADLRNLRKRPASRGEKWRRHIESCGIAVNWKKFDSAELLRLLEKEVFSPLTSVPAQATLTKLIADPNFDQCFKGMLSGDPRVSDALLLFFPVHWLRENMELLDGDFSFILLRIRSLSADEKEILLEQMKWELSYLCTQYGWVTHASEVRQHVRHVFTLLRFVAPREVSVILDALLATGILTKADIGSDLRSIEISPTFCVAPWAGLHVSSAGQLQICEVDDSHLGIDLNQTPLSMALASPALRAVREKMLRGEEVVACRGCYRTEADGARSLRMRKNDDHDRFLGTSDPSSPRIVHAELRFGNRCELKCVRCTSERSSAWYDVFNGVGAADKADQFAWYTKNFFREGFAEVLSGLRRIDLTGGDAFSFEGHREFLTACARHGHASHITLSYHANGLIDPTPYYELWKPFASVEVRVNLDSVGERDSYLRHPSRWDEVAENLRRLDRSPSNVSPFIGCFVHAFNVFYLPEMARWIRDQKFERVNGTLDGFHFLTDLLEMPDYLSVRACPPELKKVVRERIGHAVDDGLMRRKDAWMVLAHMDSAHTYSPHTFRTLKALDSKFGTNIEESLSEIVPFFTHATESG